MESGRTFFQFLLDLLPNSEEGHSMKCEEALHLRALLLNALEPSLVLTRRRAEQSLYSRRDAITCGCSLPHLLSSEGVVGRDHLAHKHGGRHHDRAARHGRRHQLGEQLLARGKPGRSTQRGEESQQGGGARIGGGATHVVNRGLMKHQAIRFKGQNRRRAA